MRFAECALGDGVEGGDGNGVTATKCRGDAARDVGRVHAASGGSERVRGGAGYPREAEVVEVLRVEVVREGEVVERTARALEGRARAEHGLPGVRVGVPGGLGTVGGVLRGGDGALGDVLDVRRRAVAALGGGPTRSRPELQLQEDIRGGGFRLLHAT